MRAVSTPDLVFFVCLVGWFLVVLVFVCLLLLFLCVCVCCCFLLLFVCLSSFFSFFFFGGGQNTAGNRTTRRLKCYGHVSRSSGLAKTILQGTVKGGKKTRQTEEEVGRQYQGMDRYGVRQVPEGNGEQRKTEETGSEAICGAPTTPRG